MDAIAHLKSILRSRSEESLKRPWEVESEIDLHIDQLERRLRGGLGTYVPRDLLQEAVERFWKSKRIDNLRDARLVSYGIAMSVGPRRLRIIEDRERFPVLLQGIDEFLPAPKRYRRCYQGLLNGYFAYDPEASEASKRGRENWITLRTYLAKHSKHLHEGDRNPQWVESLQRHKTLLGEDPCMRYGGPLLEGDHAEVNELRDVLNISNSSWFMRKLYLAQVRAAVAKPNAEFLKLIPRLLNLLEDNELIRDEGLALVLNRFAQLRSPPLAVPLRDAAVSWWGNPWLKINAMRWGRVSAEARAMVSEWLKLEFIEAFFTLLAEEHTGDNRRLKFWVRYVNSIDDIHFALGDDARENQSADFRALRKKMDGLVVPLYANVRTNNAFIMRMGSLVIVEFSGYNNACYGYNANKTLPFRLDRPVVLPVGAKNSLKHKKLCTLWWLHKDKVAGYASWEDLFEDRLASIYNIKPKGAASQSVAATRRSVPSAANPKPKAVRAVSREQKTNRTEVVARWKNTTYSYKALLLFAKELDLWLEDKSALGGYIRVQTDDSDLDINEILLKWKFRYRNAKKDWWRRR